MKDQRQNRSVRKQASKDVDEVEQIDEVGKWLDLYLNVTDPDRLSKEIARLLPRKRSMTGLPRSASDPGGRLPKSGVEISGKYRGKVTAGFGSNPAKSTTWGETGRYVTVKSKEPFGSLTLRFRLDSKDVRHLHSASIRVARWDDAAKRYYVIPNSGYSASGGYVYAGTTRTGTYTAIGLPRDPRLSRTLALFANVMPFMRLGAKETRMFVDRTCQVMLCPDAMQSMIGDVEWREKNGMSLDDFPGGFGGGDACKQCRSLDPHKLAELDLFWLQEAKEHPQQEWDIVVPDVVYEPPTWVNLGPPNVTGRITSLAIHPTNGATLYAGSSGGGVWKTTDSGATWIPTMSEECSLSIGGLGIGSNPNVLYAATGEWADGHGYTKSAITLGQGVYRTIDGADSWEECGPIPSSRCAAVAVDPTEESRVFVAGDQGLHRSTDFGRSWQTVFSSGAVSDVVIDPNNPERIYFGVHGQGVFRSDSGGDDWERLTNGFDADEYADAPRIALGLNGTHGSQFVAVKMGFRVYTSTDGGDSFTNKHDTSHNPNWSYYAWSNVIAVHPDNEGVLFAGDLGLHRSKDGGENWSSIDRVGSNAPVKVHADQQSIVFDPADHDHVYVANDGGIYSTGDASASGVPEWSFASRGLVATNFFAMGVSDTAPLRYGAAVQDEHGPYFYNGTDEDWVKVGHAEWGFLEYDPFDANVMYHGLALYKSTDGGQHWNHLGFFTSGFFAEPLAISRQTPDLLLVLKSVGESDSVIVRSTDGGNSWQDVLETLPSGTDRPMTSKSFSAIQFSPSDDSHAYAGTWNGQVWHSTDGGNKWERLGAGPFTSPENKIQNIAVDWTQPRIFHVAINGAAPRNLFRGEIDDDGVVHWFPAFGTPPQSSQDPDRSLPPLPITGLAIHPALDGVIYVATALGVWQSTDSGISWASFDQDLPNVFISDLDIRTFSRTLFVSTMGRGVYRRYV